MPLGEAALTKMRIWQQVAAVAALALAAGTNVNAGPVIDFTTLGWPTFNTTATNNTSVGGVGISGFVYTNTNTYVQNQGFLWLRNDPNDNGLGYCSTSETCGPANTTTNGDFNELSNNINNELLRLTRPTGKKWTDIWISSMDTGGTNSNETGTLYWSSSATPNLNNGTTSFLNFSNTTLGWGTSAVEGSVFTYLTGHGFDVNAPYIFFRAGKWDNLGHSTNGTNNDYVVYGVAVARVPEPDSGLLVMAGLLVLGWMGRRSGRHS